MGFDKILSTFWPNLLELQTVPFNLSNKNKSKSNLDGEQMEVTKRWETYSIVIDRNHTRFLLTATCNNNEQNIEKRKFVCQINCSIIFVAYFSTSQSEWVIAQVFMRMWTFFHILLSIIFEPKTYPINRFNLYSIYYSRNWSIIEQ